MSAGKEQAPASFLNYATLWELAAELHPGRPALIHDGRTVTWAQFDARSDALAAHLLAAGLDEQSSVAQYMRNCSEYLIVQGGVFKSGMVPVNTNYRYMDDELVALWLDCEARAVVFHAEFTEIVDRARRRTPGVRTWLWVDDGSSGPCPSWAIDLSSLAVPAVRPVHGPWGCRPDHILMLYTGGTTGLPKGVMWRQRDFIGFLGAQSSDLFGGEPTRAALAEAYAAAAPVGLPASPMMHGVGWGSALGALSQAGTVVTLSGRTFDAIEFLDAIEAHEVTSSSIVGDAFARPVADALDADPGRWNLDSLRRITSAGVMWSSEVKSRMLAHLPSVTLVDGLSSSEAVGMARSVSTADGVATTGRFVLGPAARVIGEDGVDVRPGSGEVGRIAVGGFLPLGYFNDPEKSAETFVTIDGARYSIPGDHATVEADGSVVLLGRGSSCINTAGEKVYPEEVEEVIKRLEEVADAVVVGIPDPRFGERVAAIVEPAGPVAAGELEARVVATVRAGLADYKAPRTVLVVPGLERASNGKVDLRHWREYARRATAAGR